LCGHCAAVDHLDERIQLQSFELNEVLDLEDEDFSVGGDLDFVYLQVDYQLKGKEETPQIFHQPLQHELEQ